MKTYNDLSAFPQSSLGIIETKSGVNKVFALLKAIIRILCLPFIIIMEKIAFILSVTVIVVALTMAALASIVAARAIHA